MTMIRMPHDGAETARRLARARQRPEPIGHAIALLDVSAAPDGTAELSAPAKAGAMSV